MSIFKKEPNPLGRPSNEEIKKRRNKKIIIGVIAVVGLVLIGGGAYLLISGTSLSELMGNSVTKTVRVCPNGYIYNKEHKACFVKNSTDGNNARPVKTLNISSNSYNFSVIYKNLSEYDLYVGSNYKNYKPVINFEPYTDSISVELYTINGSKYNKLSTIDFGDSYTVKKSLSKNEKYNFTYVSRLVITDVVTGKKVYAPYSNKITVSSNKIFIKPELEILNLEDNGKDYEKYENGYYSIRLSLKYNSKIFSDSENSFRYELYEVVNGKNSYIGSAHPYDQYILVKVKAGEKKQYRTRMVIDFGSKKIYSDYSDIFTINTNKYSS